MSTFEVANEMAYRETTARQAQMAGATMPSFICVECRQSRRLGGRKNAVGGWRCAGCDQAREYRKAVAAAQGVQA